MRPMMLSLILLGCTERAPVLEPSERGIVVAPGEGGEWDDPGVVGEYRAITTTIQAAIDAANPGDTITVQSGVFVENLLMRNDVHVEGAGRGETVILGSVDFLNLADTTRLSRVTVENPGTFYTGIGIDIIGGTASVEEVEVKFWREGIKLYEGRDVNLNANVVIFNEYGVWADESEDIFVGNSLFRSNAVAGVTNYTSSGQVVYNTLVGNAYAASSQVGFGGALQFGFEDTEVVKNNIVVSNYFGINCQEGCGNEFGSNLVWGNNTNYANEAGALGDDINVDPQFRDAANFDFLLTAGSPAVDAAGGVFIATDFQGEARGSGNGHDIGFDEYVQSDFDILITEVMANATVETVGEYIEIYNQADTAVNLAGLTVSDGDDLDVLQAFQGGTTVLAPGEYAVIVDPDYDGVYGIDAGVTVVTTSDTNVGNGLTTSDRVTLFESDGSTVIATFSYPEDPGDDVSLEMISLAQGDVAGNWRRSACAEDHSPGAAPCFPPSGDPTGLIISEVLANGITDNTDEFIELYNPTNLEIDAAGLVLMDNTSDDVLQGFANSGTLIGPGEHALVLDPGYTYFYWIPNGITLLTTDDQSLGNGLAMTDNVSLYKPDGTTLIDTFSYGASVTAGTSWEKVDYAAGDVAGNWVQATDNCVRGRSPGLHNAAAGGLCDQLLITEVMSNPLVEDTGEYIEVFNAGFEPVDLAGMQIVDNIQWDTLGPYMGGTTVVQPGAFALIIDAEFNGDYDIPAGVTVVTTLDTSLGNSLGVKDVVALWQGDHMVDVYGYPFNAGNGLSVERVQSRATDAAENWVASPCASGGSPGLANCAQGGTAGASGNSIYEVTITEVMANADDENSEEYVEIYNYGSVAIDLSLFVIWDGDAVDTLFDFNGGGTVLQPGQYGVIIDFDYDDITDRYDLGRTGALLLTTSDTRIGSGLSTSDEIFLLEPDGQTLIDSFTSPSNPGNDVSIEKIDRLGGDIASNWRPTACGAGNTVGVDNCP